MRFGRLVASSTLLALTLACGSPSTPAEAPPAPLATAASSTTPAPVDAARDDAAVLEHEVVDLREQDQALFARAHAAIKDGRWDEAKRLLGYLVFVHPQNTPLREQYNVVARRHEEASAPARKSLAATPLRKPPVPPTQYTLVRKVPAGNGRIRTLQKQSEKPNKITDFAEWIERHDLRLAEYFVPPPSSTLQAPSTLSEKEALELRYPPGSLLAPRGWGTPDDAPYGRDGTAPRRRYTLVEKPVSRMYLEAPLPMGVPLHFGSLPLERAIASDAYLVAVYGTHVVVVFDGKLQAVGAFDLTSYQTAAPGSPAALALLHAQAADGILYVSHWYNGYTKAVNGETGYLTAFDLATGEMAWRSAPQVCNVDNFVVVDGTLVCGYGFTSESRWATVTDRATGTTLQKMKISTTPDRWIPKGDALYVHGYRADFVFGWK